MVEYVDGIHAHLEVLGFLDPNGLLQGRVEVPLSRQCQSLPPERASCSRLGILKHNLAGLRIGNSLKCAVLFQFGRDKTALRIGSLVELIAEEIAVVAVPLNFAETFNRERSDNIGNRRSRENRSRGARRQRSPIKSRGAWGATIIIKIGGADAHRLSSAEIDNKTGLPSFDHPRQHSGAIAKQELARSKRQFENAVGAEIVGDMVCTQHIVRVSVCGIRKKRLCLQTACET